MYTSVIIALKYIFVIVVNTCVCRRSVDNKAAILSYHPWASLSVDALKASNNLQDP